MIKQLFVFLLLFCSLQSHSQKMIYNSNGNILNSENQKISPDEVRELLKDNEKLLANYNVGRKKKKVGNILLIGGSGLMVSTATVLMLGFSEGFHLENSVKTSVQGLYFVGLASVIVAVPIKIGFSKKIKNVVTEYNNLKTTGYNNPKLNLITNSQGIGFRLTLN